MRLPNEKPKIKQVCPSCWKGGYDILKSATGRPEFHCGNCGKVWTSGLNGWPYMREGVLGLAREARKP